MVKIHTHYDPPKWQPRKISQKSCLQPDQTMSLKIMVEKYVRGLPISVPQYEGVETGDEDAIDFKKLDLAEREQIINNALDELKMHDDNKTRLETEKRAKAAQKASQEAKELEELREFKKHKSSNNP